MSCPKWAIDVGMYAGGDLPAKRRARTLAHLEVCAECRELVDDLRAGQTLLSELADEPLEDVMAANVPRRVLARLPVERTGAPRRYWAWALAAGLILAGILALPPRKEKPAPLAVRQLTPPHVAEAPAIILPVHRAVVRRHRRRVVRHAAPQSSEPLLVQLVTDDPDIVIYWLVDPKPQGD